MGQIQFSIRVSPRWGFSYLGIHFDGEDLAHKGIFLDFTRVLASTTGFILRPRGQTGQTGQTGVGQNGTYSGPGVALTGVGGGPRDSKIGVKNIQKNSKKISGLWPDSKRPEGSPRRFYWDGKGGGCPGPPPSKQRVGGGRLPPWSFCGGIMKKSYVAARSAANIF